MTKAALGGSAITGRRRAGSLVSRVRFISRQRLGEKSVPPGRSDEGKNARNVTLDDPFADAGDGYRSATSQNDLSPDAPNSTPTR